MSAQIIRLFGARRGPVRAADRLDEPLDGVRGQVAQQQPAQQAHAVRRAADQARADPRRRRHGAGPIGPRPGRHVDPRPIPTGQLFSQPVGYSIAAHGQRRRPRALARRRAARAADRTQLDLRPAQLRTGSATMSYTTLDPKAQARRAPAPWRSGRLGRRARSPHRRGQGDGLDPGLRRQPPRSRHGADTSTFNRATQAGYPPGSTFKVVTATAAIDSRPVHAELDRQRQLAGDDLRRAAEQRQQPELRPDRPDDGAHLLGQHRVGPGRRAASAATR